MWPNKILKRLIERGMEKLEVRFDLMYQMKVLHHNQSHHRKWSKDKYIHEILDLDIEKHENDEHVLDMYIPPSNLGSIV